MLVGNPLVEVSMISARIATRYSIPRDHFGAELFHRREMLAGRRGGPDDYSRDAHRGEFFDVVGLQLFAQPAHRNFQRHRPLGGALMLPQALDGRRDLVVAFGDSVPAVAEFRRAFERGLGVAAEHDRRMRFLRGLGHELESFDADSLAVIFRRIAGPQLLHQRDVFARAKSGVLKFHSDSFELLFQPTDPDAENKSPT